MYYILYIIRQGILEAVLLKNLELMLKRSQPNRHIFKYCHQEKTETSETLVNHRKDVQKSTGLEQTNTLD